MFKFKDEAIEKMAERVKECVDVMKTDTVQIHFPFFDSVKSLNKGDEPINGRWIKLEITDTDYKKLIENLLYSEKTQKALDAMVEHELFTELGKKKLSEITIYTKIV